MPPHQLGPLTNIYRAQMRFRHFRSLPVTHSRALIMVACQAARRSSNWADAVGYGIAMRRGHCIGELRALLPSIMLVWCLSITSCGPVNGCFYSPSLGYSVEVLLTMPMPMRILLVGCGGVSLSFPCITSSSSNNCCGAIPSLTLNLAIR